MKLKRLVLQGYKTFATKTEFAFDEGITAIVGPNGSGKSNVADALRWVLGEQSYGALRGKRTTDMIFAGSQGRARAGLAQAILTLDNSDGWLPIEYSEVEIGRRAHRSGENEYLLNGQKVRLKDVVDLLASSGLAERTYTIIGQGLIDTALSLRADERRALFEEAAGVNHYKMRRAVTLRQLQETQRNLERVHDILAEIRPRLTSLKRQATRARNYGQVVADLRALLRIWYGHRWQRAKQQLRLARDSGAATEQAWQSSRQRLLQQQDQMQARRQEINRLQDEATRLQGQRDETRDQLESRRRQVAVLRERKHALQRQLADIDHEIPPLLLQRTGASTDLEAALADLASAQDSLQVSETAQSQFNTDFATQQQQIHHWQQRQEAAQARLEVARQRLAQAEGQLSQLIERRQEQQDTGAAATAGVRRQELTDELAALQPRLRELAGGMSDAQQALDDARQRRAALQQQQRQQLQEIRSLRQQVSDITKRLTREQQAAARLETRLEMLSQPVGQPARDGRPWPVVGQLAQLLEIPPAHQTAVAAALSTRLATLLVPDENALWELVSAGQEQRLAAAAVTDIQAPDPLPAPADDGVLGWAIDLVTVAEFAQPLARLLLGRILLVADAATAYRLALQLPAGALAVTPQGLQVHAGGLLQTGGRHADTNLLAREAERRVVQAEWASGQAEVQRLESNLAEANLALQQAQESVEAGQREEVQAESAVEKARQALTATQRALDQARQQESSCQQRLEGVAQAQAEQAQAAERLEARVAAAGAAIDGHQQQVAAAQAAVAAAQDRLAALPVAAASQQRQSLQQTVAAAQTIVAGRRAVVDSRRATLAQMDQQIARLQERRQALEAEQAQLVLSASLEEEQQQQDRLDALHAQLTPVRQALAATRQEMRRLEEEMSGFQRRTLELETQYTQAQVRLTQQENQIEGLQDRIKADLGIVALEYDDEQTGPTPLPIEDVVDQLPEVAELPEDIEDTIHQYRGQLQRMGAINPDAPEEFDETQERYDFLTQQVEDLEEAERRLRRVIEELDELTSRAFADTVAQVNDVFGHTFQQLFDGGSARLVLTDPDDLTISGVDIVARLPNRREQGLALLSGGERSLTATALIFSLLKVSPTPFCVLDEVDAALDEANINRFRELLRELSLKTQFIVITHNRGTVQAAQTIYGISMGSDSASQCISVKPEEYLKQPSLV